MDSVKRLFDIPHYQLEKFPQEVALAGKINNQWKTYSTKEYIEAANAISRGLLKLGIQPGDKIAVISHNNRPVEYHGHRYFKSEQSMFLFIRRSRNRITNLFSTILK